MMYSREKYSYIPLKDLKANAIEIIYEGRRLSMIVLLPTPDSSLEELETALENIADLKTILKFPARSEVELSLPKFKLETKFELNDTLKTMGMTDMFNENQADFSKMTSGGQKGLYVSKGKSYILINHILTFKSVCNKNCHLIIS